MARPGPIEVHDPSGRPLAAGWAYGEECEPFVLVLADSAHEVGLFDTGPWLTEAARNRRAVSLLLPTVEVRRRPDYTVRYEDIVVRQLRV